MLPYAPGLIICHAVAGLPFKGLLFLLSCALFKGSVVNGGRNALLTFQGLGLRMVSRTGEVCKPITKPAKEAVVDLR